MKDNQHEQLFTELTSAEASIIEGGATISFLSIKALKTGHDDNNGANEDPYLNFNGNRVWGLANMRPNQIVDINKSRFFDGTKTISLWDSDAGADDFIDDFTVSSARRGKRTQTLKNGRSEYQLTYEVVA